MGILRIMYLLPYPWLGYQLPSISLVVLYHTSFYYVIRRQADSWDFPTKNPAASNLKKNSKSCLWYRPMSLATSLND